MENNNLDTILSRLRMVSKPPLDRFAARIQILSAADALAEGQSRLIGAAATNCNDPLQAQAEAGPMMIQSISACLNAVNALYGVSPAEFIKLLGSVHQA